MKKLIKSGKKALLSSLIIGASILPQVGAQTNHNFFDAKLAFNYEHSLVNRLNNVPLKIRTVPKDDNTLYYSDDECIVGKRNNIKAAKYFPILETRIGNRTSFSDNIKFNTGASLELGVNSGGVTKGQEKESSKLSKIACYSSSLDEAYYSPHFAYMFKSNKWLKPSLFSEMEFNLANKPLKKSEDNINLFLGYKIYPEKIVIENGWTNEEKAGTIKKRYELSNLVVGEPYIILSCNVKNESDDYNYGTDLFLKFGLSHRIKNKFTDLGKQTDINFNKLGWFAGLGVHYRF